MYTLKTSFQIIFLFVKFYTHSIWWEESQLDISSFKVKQEKIKIKRQLIKRWLKLTSFQLNLFKLLTMKILCHCNSGFCIISRVLHTQTNQLQKCQYFKIHFFVVTRTMTWTCGTRDGADTQDSNTNLSPSPALGRL